MHARIALICLLTASVVMTPVRASAQRAPARTSSSMQVPVAVRVSVPTQRPTLTFGRLAAQSGWGFLGGLAGLTVVGLPLALASWDSANPISEDAAVAMMGIAYLAGTTAGIHRAGRNQEMRGNAIATVGGVLAGLVLAGATIQVDDEGYAEPNLLIFVAPAIGGTTGYALTRTAR
jgi:hypothetical protein